jgi:hypothetical protein
MNIKKISSDIDNDNILPPDKDKIQKKLLTYRYKLPANIISIDEAKEMLRFLGASDIIIYNAEQEACLVGKFNYNYAITIWVGTYGKKNTYGVRYGTFDLTYHGSNDTYFEIYKQL